MSSCMMDTREVTVLILLTPCKLWTILTMVIQMLGLLDPSPGNIAQVG